MIRHAELQQKIDRFQGLQETPDSAGISQRSARIVAYNLRRLMALSAMTYEDVIAATGLDARTVRSVASGSHTPQARTLHRLAEGFGVLSDELFAPPAGLSQEAFDAATNPVVDQVKASHPELFADWSAEDFAELASRFGVGGELTEAGAIDEAKKLNAKRAVLLRARVVLETAHADLLTDLINLLYERVRVYQ